MYQVTYIRTIFNNNLIPCVEDSLSFGTDAAPGEYFSIRDSFGSDF